MPNVLISELDASPAVVSTDVFLVQHAAGPPAEYCTAAQVKAFAFATTPAFTGQSTATIAIAGVAALPSGPVGFLVVSINGSPFKLPYYT